MENLKTFCNHLYFSLVAVFVSMIGLYVLLRILDVALEMVGIRLGVRDFSIGSHVVSLTIIWLAVTLGLASFLTYRTVKNRPSGEIVHTRRQF